MKKRYYLFKLNLTALNILSIIILVFLLIISSLFFEFNIMNLSNNWFGLLFWYLVYAFIHEVLHAFSYVINGAKFNKVTFGILLEKGILYCLCKQNISKKNILISSVCPLVVIGFLTYIISIIYNLPLLMFMSILNIAGSAGDIVTFLYLRKIKSFEFTEMDDPTTFALYSSKDVSKIKHFGLKFVGRQDSIKRQDFKKIDISIVSILLMLFLIIMSFN